MEDVMRVKGKKWGLKGAMSLEVDAWPIYEEQKIPVAEDNFYVLGGKKLHNDINSSYKRNSMVCGC